jgi:hypothetical protein
MASTRFEIVSSAASRFVRKKATGQAETVADEARFSAEVGANRRQFPASLR